MGNKKISLNETFSIKVPEEYLFERLDTFLSKIYPKHSRNYIKNLIIDGYVQINNKTILKSSYKVKTDENISITFPKITIPKTEEDINTNIEIIYQDPDFLIINKPINLLTHPSSQRSTVATLTHWLIHNFPEIKNVGLQERPGIVHRLDKDTSGLMLIALNKKSYEEFSKKFKDREIKKTYLALVKGHPDREGEISFNIERSPAHSNKMTHSVETGRNAQTFYKVLEYYKNTTLLKVRIVTGRTHQIRVHMNAIGYPIIGDILYGIKSKFIKRQALHAYSLEFEFKGKNYKFTKEVPTDFKKLLDKAKSGLL